MRHSCATWPGPSIRAISNHRPYRRVCTHQRRLFHLENKVLLEAEHGLQFDFPVGRLARECASRQSNRLSEIWRRQNADRRRRIYFIQHIARIDAEGQTVAAVSCWPAEHSSTSTRPSKAAATSASASSATPASTSSVAARRSTTAGLLRLSSGFRTEAKCLRQPQVQGELVRPGQVVDGNWGVGRKGYRIVTSLCRREACPRNVGRKCGTVVEL